MDGIIVLLCILLSFKRISFTCIMENLNKKTRIESLKKEVKKEVKAVAYPNLEKLSLDIFDIEKSYKKLINKFSDYFNYAINLYLSENNLDLTDMEDIELTNMINKIVKLPYVMELINYTDNKCLEICKALVSTKEKRVELTDIHLLELSIFNEYDESECIYIPIGDFTVPKKSRSGKIYLKSFGSKFSYKILSLADTLAFLTLISTSKEILKSNLNEKEECECVFVYKDPYTKETIDYMDSFSNTKYDFCYPYFFNGTCHLIIEAYSILKGLNENSSLQSKYDNNLKSEYSKSFEDKKTVSNKILNVMKKSKMNEVFKTVELDNDIDLKKFIQIENEFEILRKTIDFDKIFKNKKPELRFRRLGQHKALGLYFANLNCICIDINSTKSFMHEIGHCIDFTIDTSKSLSSSINFLKVIKEYQFLYSNEMKKDEDVKKFLSSKKSYYFRYTEIFARALEVYLSKVKNMESSFLRKEFDIKSGYVSSDKFISLIKDYFDNLFKQYAIEIKENISTLIQKKEIENKTIDVIKDDKKDGNKKNDIVEEKKNDENLGLNLVLKKNKNNLDQFTFFDLNNL